MICQPCKDKNHEECPSRAAQDQSKPTMALSPEGERIQLTGLCPCQHKVPMAEEEPKIIFSGVARSDDPDFGAQGECRAHELNVYDNGWFVWSCPDCGMSASNFLEGETRRVVLAGGGEEVFGDRLAASGRATG